jgi:hypothetical protein
VDAAQPRLVGGSESWAVEQSLDHDRREVRGGHALGFYRTQDRGGVETAVKNDGRAQEREGELLDPSADVKQRHDDEHDVGAARATFVGDAPRRLDNSGMAQHHALRPPGCPAGIDE